MKRILLVKLSPLGEVILAGSMFEAFLKAFPKAWITALVRPPAHQILKRSGWVNEVFAYDQAVMDRRNIFTQFWKNFRLTRALQKRRFDLAVDFSGTLRSAQIAKSGGAELNLGLGLPAIKGFYDWTAEGSDALQVPTSELDRRIAALLGLNTKVFAGEGGLWPVPEEAFRFADTFWKAAGFADNDMVLAVNPFADRETKEWYPEKWAAVIDELTRNQFKIFFTCWPLEKKRLGPILAKLGRSLPVYAESSLVFLMGLYRKANAVLTVDSGPGHLAAAVGTPTLTLWGPESARRFYPYFPERHALVMKEVPCRPCGLEVCVEKKHECMVAIQPADVLKGLKDLLRRTLPSFSRTV